jgi:hypothetical protein
MDESITLRSLVRAKVHEDARKQFVKGAGRDSHGMNPGSPAVADFQAEYDRLDLDYRAASNQVLAAAMVMGATPP